MSKPRATPPKPHAPTPPAKADWERDQFSLRLTGARRERLMRIAADMPAGSTPIEAVDRAIERSLAEPAPAGEDATSERLDALEELVGRFEIERKRDAAGARAASDETLGEVRLIAALMSVVAELPDGDGSDRLTLGASVATTQSLRSWLDARSETRRPVVAVGRWRSTTRLADEMVSVEFEIAPAGSPAARSLVRVSTLPKSNPLARADQGAPTRFSCSWETAGRWAVEARQMNPNRSLGAVVAEFSI